ncbi:hypothetical protein [Pseudomonas aeruginosa]|uniref:hypothetical protein n=1 Tax=Pseudomonas aeruginosa TaxID=287 RepID=UPI0011423DE3|nr:hypothetical protein [Pseudomonas aeruginosa]
MKEKFKIKEKSIWLCLAIIRYELIAFDISLSQKKEELQDLINWLRHTISSFVTLKNLYDIAKTSQISNDPKFCKKTRNLRKNLEFINHIRNKTAGHMDPHLVERAVQWTPEIFLASTETEDTAEALNHRIFYCYKGLLESAINSFLSKDKRQKIFNHEIDISYPPDQKEFYIFLKDIITISIEWIDTAIPFIEANGIFHERSAITELGCLAGQTNFDLKSKSSFNFDTVSIEAKLEHLISELEIDEDQKEILKSLTNSLTKKTNHN